MIIIKLTPKTRAFAVASAIKILAKGGVIAFATETVYGIGCDPRNARAVNRVFAIKGRNEKKPCQLIAGSGAQVNRLAFLNRFESVRSRSIGRVAHASSAQRRRSVFTAHRAEGSSGFA